MSRKPGFHHSRATKKKMRLAALGRVFTPEHRKHLCEAKVGYVHTDEWRAAVSRALRGKKQSKRHIEARRKALTGIVYGEDARRKNSEWHKQWWANLTKEQAEAAHKQRMLKWHSESSLERKVQSELKSRHIKFCKHQFIAGYFPDIYIPSIKLVIEVDGEYWHFTATAIARDRLKDKTYRAAGYKVVRMKECDVKKNVSALVQKVLDL